MFEMKQYSIRVHGIFAICILFINISVIACDLSPYPITTITVGNETTLPENLFENYTSLSGLRLEDKNLTSIPENIFKDLTNLMFISMNQNELTSLPETVFSSQRNLEHLDVSYNKLTTLPENIFKHSNRLGGIYISTGIPKPSSRAKSIYEIWISAGMS